MPPIRFRDDDGSSGRGLLFLAAGAVAGIALGAVLAQRLGGFSALSSRVRERFAGGGDAELAEHGHASHGVDDSMDELDTDEIDALEEHVLEAFRNDPILSERAVDIGAIGEDIIELTGWVQDHDESDHAVVLARGVPGVVTVVNRLDVRADDEEYTTMAHRYASGDPALTEAHWEGQQVGIGRRRQGSSAEIDRHADPKVNLEDRWMKEDKALTAAAEETDGAAERRASTAAPIEGDRTGGSPIAPTGVPKADHVADPDSAAPIQRKATGRETRRAD